MNGFLSKVIMYHSMYGSAQCYDNYLGIGIKITRFFFPLMLTMESILTNR